jgi:cytochrome c
MKLTYIALATSLAFGAIATPAIAQDATATFDRAAEIEAAIAAGDVKKGEKVFKKCNACHKIGDDAKNAVGPQLNNFFGNEIGSVADYKYSDALLEKKASGQIWDIEALDAFLLKPRDYIKKTKMSFAGLKKEKDRANVIAFLASIQAAE